MTGSEATKYYAYARECLRQAEAADTADRREKLIELSRVWVEAALNEQLLHLRSQHEPVCLRASGLEGSAEAT
jgi:hypothetical protein